jgi:hypothetical protein
LALAAGHNLCFLDSLPLRHSRDGWTVFVGRAASCLCDVCWRLCDAACKIHNTAFFRLDRCNTLSAAASKHVCVRYVLRSICLAQTMHTMCARGLKQGVVCCIVQIGCCILHLLSCWYAVSWRSDLVGHTRAVRVHVCWDSTLLRTGPEHLDSAHYSSRMQTQARRFLEARGRARCWTTHTSQLTRQRPVLAKPS